MSEFWSSADFATRSLYVMVFGAFSAYVAWKFVSRRYIFSPYSIPVLTFAFMLLVIGPLQYDTRAWTVLGRRVYGGMDSYLNASMKISLTGFLVMLFVMWVAESRRVSGSLRAPLVGSLPSVTPKRIQFVALSAVGLFVLCLAVVGTVPLFGSRTVFNATPAIRPVYNFANFTILFATSVMIVQFWTSRVRGIRPAVLIFAGLTCMLLTGGRTSFLSCLQLILILWAYSRFRGRTGVATAFLSCGLLGVAVLGLVLASVRVGEEFALGEAVGTAAYGNTFSDLRDGAYILWAWDLRFGGESLDGRSYLAGLMSFLPSDVSEFRSSFSWGYYTTSTLFGFDGHYGFRGGWSMEAYMNFAWVGVVVFAGMVGYLLGRLESNFFHGVILADDSDYSSVYAAGWVGYLVYTVLIASSATYNLISLFVVLAGIWLVSQFSRRDMQDEDRAQSARIQISGSVP